MKHVSRTHRVALDWLFDRINLDSKNPNQVHRHQNQLDDMLTNGNFTRDEWNHLLCLFNINHFSSTVCSETMAKRSQHDSGEERVTAKSRPMMSLIARAPSHVSSSTSVSSDPRTALGHGQFVESSFSASYSKWDDDKAWSSQEWKADRSMDDRTGQPVVTSW